MQNGRLKFVQSIERLYRVSGERGVDGADRAWLLGGSATAHSSR